MTTNTASRWPDADQAAGGSGAAEFGDLATIRRFAEQISALGDGSDYTQTIAACAALRDMIRDFGGDMNKSVAAFVDAATAVARSGQELTAQAVQVAALAADMSGDGSGRHAQSGAWSRPSDPRAGMTPQDRQAFDWRVRRGDPSNGNR